MENKFDHIEDSVRKAFEGFELPVSDADWSRISAGLESGNSKKGFAYWWNNTRKNRLVWIGLLLLSLGGITWWWSNKNNSQSLPAKQESKKVETGIKDNQSVQRQAPKASGESSMDGNVTGVESAGNHPSNGAKAPYTSVTPAKGGNGQTTNNNTGSHSNQTNETSSNGQGNLTPETNQQPVVATTTNPDAVNTGTVETPDPNQGEAPLYIPNFSGLYGFGVRPSFMDMLLHIRKNVNPDVKNPLAPLPSAPIPFYVSLQTSYAPGGLKQGNNSNIWAGVKNVNGQFATLDVRLDGGVVLGTGDWKFTFGGALEGNALQDKKGDTMHIWVADRFLPYKDSAGKTLYWLAIRWKDSAVVLSHGPQRMWAEIPLGLYRAFDFKNDLKISLGITLNPGILLGGSGEIANPYVYKAGSDWNYNYGVQNADTTSAVISAKPFLNPLRLGNSIQLGIEKDMKTWSWGIQAQTRYYYTPVWRTGVPIKQNTIQYGINLRLGFKI